MNGSTKLEEAFSNFFGCQFVDCPQSAITEIIDIVNVCNRITDPQLDHVADRINDIFCLQGHFGIGNILIKFSIDSEPTDSTQTITICVKELFVEQFDRFFKLRWITWTQSLINPQQRVFVCNRWIFQNAGQSQKIVHRFDDFDGFQRGSTNLFRRRFCNHVAKLDDNLATLFVLRRIDNLVSGILTCEMGNEVIPVNLDRLGLVEQFDEIRTGPVIRVHGAQERHR